MIPRSVSQDIDEIGGSTKRDSDEQRLMSSILEGKGIEEGKLIKEAINHGIFSFNPDMIFDKFTGDFSEANETYGSFFLKDLSVSARDMNLPEVQRKVKQNIRNKLEDLYNKELINKNLNITEKGIVLAALSLYVEELDKLVSKGLIGEKLNKKCNFYGDDEDFRNFKSGDRYRDIALKKSVKLAVRRSHRDLEVHDLRVFEKGSRGKIYIVYALDASGSMKGKKMDMCKKAGLALAFKAINEMDKVGLIVFGSDVESIIEPTSDFYLFLKSIVRIRAKKETNIATTILKAIEMFPSENLTKHLILITDAIPTYGKSPVEDAFDAVSKASRLGITISVVGIGLDKEGADIAQRISELGNGKLYVVNNIENLDYIVLQDYYSL